VLIVPGGRLADLFGRTRILMIGAAIFAGFSLLGGLAPNVWLLIAARCLMAIGGAMMWPAILGLIYALMPEDKAGLAGGLVLGVAGIGNAAGPMIAGALTAASWRYIFFLNVPISLLAIVVVWRAVHVEDPDERQPIDYLGVALLALSLGSLLAALTLAPSSGLTTSVTVGFVVAAVGMVAFVVRERAVGERALVPPSVMAVRPFLWACLSVLALSATFFATLLYLPQFFQKILGESAWTAGLMLLPFVGVFAASSFAETWLLNRIGMKAVITIGAACIFAGPVLFVALLGQDSGFPSLVPGMIVLGIGVGLFYSSVTTAALTALDSSKSSLAGGLLYMFQVAGGAIGLGITTAVFLVGSNREITQGATDVGVRLTSSQVADVQGVLAGTDTSQQLLGQFPAQANQLAQIVRDAFVSGMKWAFTLDLALALVGVVIAAWKVGGPLSQFGRDAAEGRAEATDEPTDAAEAPATVPPRPAVRRHLVSRHSRHVHRHTP
jgi:EmrB/QacA subfamily drug resistance transporter